MIRFTLATLLSLAAVARTNSFSNGDTCGVTSKDFMNYDYRSDYLVAGEAGCNLGDETGCFCAPNLEDGKSLGEWEWQCGNVVNFGPSISLGKVCPTKVPVAKGLGELDIIVNRNRALQSGPDNIVSIGTESQQQQLGVSCDTAVNPTGQPGDEVCPYSDCDEGGDHSAICACIDLTKYGMGEGMEWVCMHASCSCGEQDNQVEQEDFDESIVSAASGTSVLLSLCVMVMAVIFN